MINIAYLTKQNDILADKLTKALKQLQHQRDENMALRAVTRKDSRSTALEDKLLEVFESSIKKVKPIPYDPEKYRDVQHEWGNIVGMSDWHIGEEVDKEQTEGLGEFNYVIADKRIKKYIKKIKSSNINRSKNLIIADLGDNIRGIIHGGLQDTEESLMVSLVKCFDITVSFIKSMLTMYDKINYQFVVGNHSRLEDMIKSKDKYQDYSWLVIQMVIRMFENEPRVKFNISKSGYAFFKVNGVGVMMFHGDTFRNYNPTSATSRTILQDHCFHMFKEYAKFFISGHTHVPVTVANQYGGFNVISGCLVGSNEYGVQGGLLPIHPYQLMMDIDYRGECSDIKHFPLGSDL